MSLTRTVAYAAAIIAASVAMLAVDLIALPTWGHSWSPMVVLLLLLLCIAAVHLQFQIHSGLSTDAGTVPHIATALLLPPGLAMLLVGLGLVTYGLVRRRAWLKLLFNAASGMLAVGVAAHLATAFGGPDQFLDSDTLPDVVMAFTASVAYLVVSTTTVAGVVALDQRRSIWRALAHKVSPRSLADVALGMLGSTLAVTLLLVPVFAPVLIVPGILLYLANQVMDRAERRSRNLALSNRVGQAVARTLRPEHAFEAILSRDVRDTLKLDGMAVLPLGEPAPFRPHIASDLDQPELLDALVGEIEANPRPLEVRADGASAAGWLPESVRVSRVVVAAYPCGVAGERPTGVLVAWRGAQMQRPRAFDREEMLLLQTLADYAAVAVETLGGRMAADERATRVRAIMDGVADGLLTVDESGRIESCNPAAERLFGYSVQELLGLPVAQLLPDALWPTASSGAPLVWETSGRLHQEVTGHRSDGSRFSAELALSELRLGERRMSIAAIRDISERKALEEQLRHMAFHDPLSGLPNRALFLDRLGQALARSARRSAHVAVFFLDLDNLKVVNDSLGHEAGDVVLLGVAERLRRCLRPEDTAARFGGDEFAVLLEDVSGVEDANTLAERIAEQLSVPLNVEGHDIVLSASIGIAISGRPLYETAEGLVRQADLAMYEAKTSGKARHALFDERMNERAMARLELEGDLRRALERDEFRVFYQPIVSMKNRQIVEVEALVRWQRPDGGLVPPAVFIPLAEETGLIVPLGQWVLEHACKQARAWQLSNPHMPPLVISVNLSARQFQHTHLVEDIQRALTAANLDPRHLKLEITESAVMKDADDAVATLEALKKLGIQLAIDDFGTGYSSLSYLKSFPIDTLKIDRSFVEGLGRDDQGTAIVRSVVALAKALNLSVTGEGIETSSQCGYLQMLGCDRGQGYLFAPPQPAEALGRLLTVGSLRPREPFAA